MSAPTGRSCDCGAAHRRGRPDGRPCDQHCGTVTYLPAPTRLAPSDGSLPVMSRDGVWAYTWDADQEHGSRAVATRVATGEQMGFVDFDAARRWTAGVSE